MIFRNQGNESINVNRIIRSIEIINSCFAV